MAKEQNQYQFRNFSSSGSLAQHIKIISCLKKLTGYKNSYRIRLGAYRIGLIIEGNTVIFAAFDHRSDIYKYFP